MKNTSGGLMDCEFSSPEVSVKTTRKKRVNKKNPNPKFYTRLIQCLDNGEYMWMLKYVPGTSGNQFEVTFTDRKNKKVWKEDDIGLFVELDKHIGNIFKRKRSTKKYEEDVKIRFKSNMCKCVNFNFIEKIGEKKIGKGKTVKKYKILWKPRPSPSVSESSGNDENDRKSKVKSCRKVNKKIDKKKICKNETVCSTLCTSKNYNKSQNAESHLTKECKGLKGHHEIAHLASIVQGNNNKMHSENMYQENNRDFSNFCEDYSRNDFQYNHAANYQIDKKKICKNEKICLILCTSENYEKNQNVESHLTKECKGLKGYNEIAHVASMVQENNCDFSNFCDDYSRNDFQYNHAANYQMEMDRNGHVDSTFENLDNFDMVDNMEMDENGYMDFTAELGNLKISCPPVGFEKYDDPNAFDASVYLNKSDLTIEKNISCKVVLENASSQMTNTGCESSHDYTNANGGMTQETLYTFFSDDYTEPLCQGNQFLENEFEEIVLKSDPLLCSVPKEFQQISNSLGDCDDWSGTYQELKPVELNEVWKPTFGN